MNMKTKQWENINTVTKKKNHQTNNSNETSVEHLLYIGLFLKQTSNFNYWGNQIKIWCLLDYFFSVKRSNKHLILIIGRLELRTMIFSNVIFVYILCLSDIEDSDFDGFMSD
jgi:hypothetical protein